MRFRRDELAFEPTNGFIGKAQLGEHLRNATYLTSHRDAAGRLTLYIVDEREDGPGSVLAARVEEASGELHLLSSVPAMDVAGKGACCHVSVTPDERFVLAANYLGGSVCAIPRSADGSLDSTAVQYVQLPPAEHPVAFPLPNAARQDKSHAHMVLFSAGTASSTVLVPDLGSDTVWALAYDGSRSARPLGAPQPTARDASLSGGGPRHAALHPTLAIAYVAYELTSQVAAFAIATSTGAITGAPLAVFNVLDGRVGAFLGGGAEDAEATVQYANLVGAGEPPRRCSDQHTSVAALRVSQDGRFVIASTRPAGGVGAVLSATPLAVDGLPLASQTRLTSTLGLTCRDFALLPALATSAHEAPMALAANQDSGTISVMCEGELPRMVTNADVPTPVCLFFTV